jgi:hypothetical protein
MKRKAKNLKVVGDPGAGGGGLGNKAARGKEGFLGSSSGVAQDL